MRVLAVLLEVGARDERPSDVVRARHRIASTNQYPTPSTVTAHHSHSTVTAQSQHSHSHNIGSQAPISARMRLGTKGNMSHGVGGCVVFVWCLCGVCVVIWHWRMRETRSKTFRPRQDYPPPATTVLSPALKSDCNRTVLVAVSWHHT